MSYAMSMLKQEIGKRMKGECRLNVQTGAVLRMDGDRMESCADCPAYCMGGARPSGYANTALQIEIVSLGEGRAKLVWACPGCGHETVEDSSVLKAQEHAKQIERDPLCFTCRSKRSGVGE